MRPFRLFAALALLLLAAASPSACAPPTGVALAFRRQAGKVYKGVPYEVTWEGGEPVPLDVHLVRSANTSDVVAVMQEDVFNADPRALNWTVPAGLDVGVPLRVRVSVRDSDPLQSELSAAAFTVNEADVSITSPEGGDLLSIAFAYTFTWEEAAGGDVPPLEVWLRENSAGIARLSVLAGSVAHGEDSLVWTVPSNVPTNGGPDAFHADLVLQDGTGRSSRSDDFAMRVPNIEVQRPAGSDYLFAGRGQNVTWSTDGDVANVDIVVMNLNDEVLRVAESVPDTGFYTWDVPVSFVTGGDQNYYIRLEHSLVPSFKWDGEPFESRSYIQVTSPSQGQEVPRGDRITIQWSGLDHVEAVDISVFDASCASEVRSVVTALAVARSTGNEASYAWTVPRGIDVGDPAERFTVRVTSSLEPGNLGCSPMARLVAPTTAAPASEGEQVGGLDLAWFILLVLLVLCLFVSCCVRFLLARKRELMDDEEMVPELAHSASSLTAFSVG